MNAGAYVNQHPLAVRATIDLLRRCQAARAAGHSVYLTTDPAWLVTMAINRKAGWLEDLHTHASCMPVGGKYPRKAEGDAQRHLRRIAHEVNTPRLIVREQTLGEWRGLIMARIPHRITTAEDER